MNSLALLIALGATSGVSSCPGGSCATPAYAYTYAAPANCAGGSCVGYQAPRYYAPQPAAVQPVYTTQAAPQTTYAPVRTYTPQAYTPAPVAQAPTYYYSSYAAASSYGCANGQCYRR